MGVTMPDFGCNTCGVLNSGLRAYEFYEGTRGVWCKAHFDEVRRSVPAQNEDDHRSFFIRVPGTNADLLMNVATELKRRGQKEEASSARAAAEAFEAQYQSARQEIPYEDTRDLGNRLTLDR
jgi:hypothetical protein